MKIFNKIEKIIEPKTAVFHKVKPIFETIDGKLHNGKDYRWAKVSGLLCTVSEYLMIDINSNGYIEDEEGIMYPLSNVLSIKWKLIGKKTTLEPSYKDHYRTFFDDYEVLDLELELNRKK